MVKPLLKIHKVKKTLHIINIAFRKKKTFLLSKLSGSFFFCPYLWKLKLIKGEYTVTQERKWSWRVGKYITSRAQSFTSCIPNLCQNINIVPSFSVLQ